LRLRSEGEPHSVEAAPHVLGVQSERPWTTGRWAFQKLPPSDRPAKEDVMTYWLILVVIGFGSNPTGGSNVPSAALHVGNFPSFDVCANAAKEAMSKNGNGSPNASYRFLCVEASNGIMPPPQ
jgi:hypothetical protein